MFEPVFQTWIESRWYKLVIDVMDHLVKDEINFQEKLPNLFGRWN